MATQYAGQKTWSVQLRSRTPICPSAVELERAARGVLARVGVGLGCVAWAENLERMSPEDRMKVNRSAREWRALPADRQAVMKNAFRDLRTVPPDQRSIVLNSARYQGQFTPQERGILGDMLRVEPYEAPK